MAGSHVACASLCLLQTLTPPRTAEAEANDNPKANTLLSNAQPSNLATDRQSTANETTEQKLEDFFQRTAFSPPAAPLQAHSRESTDCVPG